MHCAAPAVPPVLPIDCSCWGKGARVSQPYLSVLIPAYNEDRTLEHVIDAVLKVPEDIEIILIDDGSDG